MKYIMHIRADGQVIVEAIYDDAHQEYLTYSNYSHSRIVTARSPAYFTDMVEAQAAIDQHKALRLRIAEQQSKDAANAAIVQTIEVE